jgi:hypothetical protein
MLQDSDQAIDLQIIQIAFTSAHSEACGNHGLRSLSWVGSRLVYRS